MNILVVFCHPRRDSFNGAVLDRVCAALEETGHAIDLLDLYREEFQPAFIEADFAQFEHAAMPDDVLAMQQRVEWSDGLVFVFPVWWWSLPAMLKGWIDRVFSYGWAWEDPSDPDSGHLDDRRILVLPTAGASEQAFAKRGYDVALHTQLDVGTWSYCGFRDVTTEVLHNVDVATDSSLLGKRLERAGEVTRTTFPG